MFKRIPIFLCLIWGSYANAQGLHVGDLVSFPDNNWIWTISLLNPDTGGSLVVTPGIDGRERQMFVEMNRLFPIVNEAEGFEAGNCYKITDNRLLWKILGLTPEIPGLTPAKAFIYNPDV